MINYLLVRIPFVSFSTYTSYLRFENTIRGKPVSGVEMFGYQVRDLESTLHDIIWAAVLPYQHATTYANKAMLSFIIIFIRIFLIFVQRASNTDKALTCIIVLECFMARSG